MMRILSVGFESALLDRRNAALRAEGYTVDAARSETDAVTLSGSERYAAAVFGHAVPEFVRALVVRQLRHANPHVVIVLLYDGKIQNAEVADAVLSVGDPAKLVEAIRFLLQARRGAAS